MKGQILDFSVQSGQGTISGNDGNRYSFKGSEWKGNTTPVRGMSVDFEMDGNQAKGIYVAIGTQAAGSKNKIAAGLLGIFPRLGVSPRKYNRLCRDMAVLVHPELRPWYPRFCGGDHLSHEIG